MSDSYQGWHDLALFVLGFPFASDRRFFLPKMVFLLCVLVLGLWVWGDGFAHVEGIIGECEALVLQPFL